MLGDQRLVGGDDRTTLFERGLDRVIGDAVGAADQFDEEIDRLRRGERNRIIKESDAIEIDAAVAASIASRDGGHNDRPARAVRQGLALTLQQPHQAGADNAEAGDADAQNFRHEDRPFWLRRLVPDLAEPGKEANAQRRPTKGSAEANSPVSAAIGGRRLSISTKSPNSCPR